uniref:SMP-30/Gluconolactonase/LRE-like region domain-containing protein n=1 Tax=Hanusia phi TaxID=3032 RepID=A0A7S0EZI9_9CRYP|mmetsp:Transcript_34866/g.78781  ORF Transcript_34866/g.78781 Transcript_34866/m.78781 type:complete len:853 (+) Transcript_34866:497-3055(+)|eukprot:763778-Hanusia_phi.AAC.23
MLSTNGSITVKNFTVSGAFDQKEQELKRPAGICSCLHASGANLLFVADAGNNCIKTISEEGCIERLEFSPLSTGQIVERQQPRGLASSPSGEIFVSYCKSHVIAALSPLPSGVWHVRIVAGCGQRGYEDGSHESCRLNGPRGLALDFNGDLYIADSLNCRIRRLRSRERILETVAGSGKRESRDGDLMNASFAFPYGLAWDLLTNTLIVSEQEGHKIRRVDFVANTVTTVAGTGACGHRDGDASQATFNEPCFLACDRQGNIFVADSRNDSIRQITPEGIVYTLVGRSEPDLDLSGTHQGTMKRPWGICIVGNRDIFVTDGKNNSVKKICFADRSWAKTGRFGEEAQDCAERTYQGNEGQCVDQSRPKSPTEELLLARCMMKETTPSSPSDSRVEGGIRDSVGKPETVSCVLSFGEKYSQDATERLRMESRVISDIACAVSSSPKRFTVTAMQEDKRGCISIELCISLLSEDDGLMSLSPMQIGEEIRRQISDPSSPLRNSPSMRRIMHCHLHSKKENKETSRGSFGAPDVMGFYGSSEAPERRSMFGLTLCTDSNGGLRSKGHLDGSDLGMSDEGPSLAGAPMKPWQWESSAIGHAEGLGGHPALQFSGTSSPLSLQSSTSPDSLQSPFGANVDAVCDLLQSFSPQTPSPQLLPDMTRKSVEVEFPLFLGSSSAENRSSSSESPNTSEYTFDDLETLGEGWDKNNSGRSTINAEAMKSMSPRKLLAVVAALQRRLAETESEKNQLEISLEKQSQHILALKGLSSSQAKEVESLSAKIEVLVNQLRDEKRKSKETAMRRKEMKALSLSHNFGLEQELHAERMRTEELRRFYESELAAAKAKIASLEQQTGSG